IAPISIKDASTRATCPLSLHDALPIYGHSPMTGRESTSGTSKKSPGRPSFSVTSCCCSASCCRRDRSPEPAAGRRPVRPRLDEADPRLSGPGPREALSDTGGGGAAAQLMVTPGDAPERPLASGTSTTTLGGGVNDASEVVFAAVAAS